MMLCLEHKEKARASPSWEPPRGIDPKMRRYCCNLCIVYWYHAPKTGRLNQKEFEKLVARQKQVDLIRKSLKNESQE